MAKATWQQPREVLIFPLSQSLFSFNCLHPSLQQPSLSASLHVCVFKVVTGSRGDLIDLQRAKASGVDVGALLLLDNYTL